MAHARKPDFALLRFKCDGTCADTRFRLTVFEMWRHMRSNQISSCCIWNVMVHAQKPDFVFRWNGRVRLNRQGASVQSTTGSRGVRIRGSNVGYTMFRSSVKSTDYPLHSPVSPSLLHLCVIVCHHISTGLYDRRGSSRGHSRDRHIQDNSGCDGLKAFERDFLDHDAHDRPRVCSAFSEVFTCKSYYDTGPKY